MGNIFKLRIYKKALGKVESTICRVPKGWKLHWLFWAMKLWQRICFNEAFFFLLWEREKTGVVLAVYKTSYNLLTGVPRIKKTTVLLSFETSYLSHWFRSNYKGRVGNYTMKLVFFFSFRIRKKSRFLFWIWKQMALKHTFYCILSLFISLSHGSWEEDFHVS